MFRITRRPCFRIDDSKSAEIATRGTLESQTMRFWIWVPENEQKTEQIEQHLTTKMWFQNSSETLEVSLNITMDEFSSNDLNDNPN
jgi:hypothetical protein